MEVTPGYKTSEIGLMPDDWVVKSLKQISPRQGVGLVINPSAYFDKAGTVPLLVGSNISENSIDATGANRISASSNAELSASRLVAGDLVTVRVGEPGVTAVVPPELDGCNCASMMIIRQHPSFDSHWLCYAMNSQGGRRQVEHVQYGTAQKQFNISDAVDFRYAVPGLIEQRAIAAALRDIDELLNALERLLAKKRDLKQAVSQQLLTGRTRLPGYNGDWGMTALSDLADIARGASPRPIDSPIWFDDSSPVGWVRISDVTRSGMYLLDTTQKLSSLGVQHSRQVSRGSLIMSIAATVGKPVITAFDVCIHDGFVVFDNLRVDKVFLYYALQFIESDWSRQGQTGSQMNLNTALINRTEIGIPPTKAEQSAIAAVIEDIDKELSALETRRRKTRAIKQGMMQELLSGRTRLI